MVVANRKQNLNQLHLVQRRKPEYPRWETLIKLYDGPCRRKRLEAESGPNSTVRRGASFRSLSWVKRTSRGHGDRSPMIHHVIIATVNCQTKGSFDHGIVVASTAA